MFICGVFYAVYVSNSADDIENFLKKKSILDSMAGYSFLPIKRLHWHLKNGF